MDYGCFHFSPITLPLIKDYFEPDNIFQKGNMKLLLPSEVKKFYWSSSMFVGNTQNTETVQIKKVKYPMEKLIKKIVHQGVLQLIWFSWFESIPWETLLIAGSRF